METIISLKNALDILSKKYERDYSSYENVKVSYAKEDNSFYSGKWPEEETVRISRYDLYGLITYEKKVNGFVIQYEVIKKIEKIKQDLKKELMEYYLTDDMKIVSINLELNACHKKIDYDQKVSIRISEKVKKLVK